MARGVRSRRPGASADDSTGVVYERRRPERTTLYEVVRDNVQTLYGAIDDEAIAIRIPEHAKKELEAYLDCGLLCRGFARLCARVATRAVWSPSAVRDVVSAPRAWAGACAPRRRT
jgi:hypothetical protein